jgi:hypothetical protein
MAGKDRAMHQPIVLDERWLRQLERAVIDEDRGQRQSVFGALAAGREEIRRVIRQAPQGTAP